MGTSSTPPPTARIVSSFAKVPSQLPYWFVTNNDYHENTDADDDDDDDGGGGDDDDGNNTNKVVY